METGFFRGEGGTIHEMDLPLGEIMQGKLTLGYLKRVNADGSDWVEPGSEVEPATPAAIPDPPKSTAPKLEWVGYAVRAHGMKPDDAEAITKADLVERFGGRR